MSKKKKKEDIEDHLKRLGREDVDADKVKELYKVPILKTRASSRIGILLVLFPLLFLLGVLLENYLNVHGSILSRLYRWVTEEVPDRDDSVVSWIIRFLLLGGPLIVLGINLLSIIHVFYNQPQRELILTVKLKWLNLLLILISGGIICVFIWYSMVETH